MFFLHPLLLAGLLLAGLPILVHLIMRQKPKRLVFPAFRFLLQRHRSNQRKLQLRHLLLLALRMALLILVCLALAGPKLLDQGILPAVNGPVAAVLIFDTRYSMEYTPTGGSSRLEEAKQRGTDLVESLPANSRIAILDTAQPGGDWEVTRSMARERIARLQPRPNNYPITSQLPLAFDMLARVNEDRDNPDERLSPCLFILSDRVSACWEQGQGERLKQSREHSLPDLHAVFVDVGVKEPADLAVTGLELAQESVPAQQPVTIRATVRAIGTGGAAEPQVVCRIDGEKTPDRKPAHLEPGEPQVVVFERAGLSRGLHQVKVSVEPADPTLLFNNSRYATFEVRQARQVLTIADSPKNAGIWKAALEAGGAFHCDVRTTQDFTDGMSLNDLKPYQAICLLGVADPGHQLWLKLADYVAGGGGLAVVPGGGEMQPAAYNDVTARMLLPGALGNVASLKGGVLWSWTDQVYQHSLLQPFRDWNRDMSIDFVSHPPTTRTFWQVKPLPSDEGAVRRVLIRYTDKDHSPALLETVAKKAGRGRVLMFTTRLDNQQRDWHDYASLTSFYVVLAQLTAGYLVGDADRKGFNYTSGQPIQVALPPDSQAPTYTVQGPGLVGADAIVPRPTNGNILQLSQAVQPENYRVFPQGSPEPIAAFSVNVPSDESDLEKVPADKIEAVLGPGSIVPSDSKASLAELLRSSGRQPLDLYPGLMILLLLALAVENLLANKFYRSDAARQPEGAEG